MLLGRSIDIIITQFHTDKKSGSFFLGLLQLFINGLVLYTAFKLITFRFGREVLTLDDWMSSTFQGLIFVTTLYSVQNNIYENFKKGLF